MPAPARPWNAHDAGLHIALVLLPVLAWPVLAHALSGEAARPSPPAPLAVASACDGRLRIEEVPHGAGVRLRVVNPSEEALAWRPAGAARLAVLRGGGSAWLDAPTGVICR